jgi:hypothetical protein
MAGVFVANAGLAQLAGPTSGTNFNQIHRTAQWRDRSLFEEPVMNALTRKRRDDFPTIYADYRIENKRFPRPCTDRRGVSSSKKRAPLCTDGNVSQLMRYESIYDR